MSKNNKEAILYLLPAAVLFLVFYYWPLLQNMYLSVFSWNMISPNQKFVGLENFITIFSSAELIKILINTILFVGNEALEALLIMSVFGLFLFLLLVKRVKQPVFLQEYKC